MHSSIDYLTASFVSWIVLSVFIYFALNLDSEEVNARKKMEKKLMEQNKNNGNQRK